eukprot:scaffold149128_cov43-Prasinocladus_malaysianus.AAC.1
MAIKYIPIAIFSTNAVKASGSCNQYFMTFYFFPAPRDLPSGRVPRGLDDSLPTTARCADNCDIKETSIRAAKGVEKTLSGLAYYNCKSLQLHLNVRACIALQLPGIPYAINRPRQKVSMTVAMFAITKN